MTILQFLVHFSHKVDVKYDLIEINDFRVIFWQKLANFYDIICAIDLFPVKLDRKKLLESGDTPLQTYHCSLLNWKISKKIKKNAN